MKRLFISLVFIGGFAGYVTFTHFANSAQSATTQVAEAQTVPVVQAPATPAPIVKPTPVPKKTGQYADGVYIGNPEDAYYGNIQVKVTISGGKLTKISFLQYPNDRSTSVEINKQAMPQLAAQAIQAQSANVDGVSGASESSPAFSRSLASALTKAKA